MIYMRGQAADYDHWRQLGLVGWSWNDVLPYFKQHEDHFLGDGPFHGAGGEWRVEHPRVRWAILDKVREAAAQAGIPPIDDFNRGDNEGSCYFQVNQRRGLRWSSARGFLRPARKRPNLKIETDAHVQTIDLDGRRAVGVRYTKGGEPRQVRCRGEVVLAAGAIGSPQLLMLSGIGPADHLSASGISVSLDRPGVGANLQDHLQLRLIFRVGGIATMNEQSRSMWRRAWMGIEYALLRRGPLTMAPSQLGFFTRSDRERDRANLQFHVQPLSLDKYGDPLHPFPAFTISPCNLQPTSRGTVRLRGREAGTGPAIQLNYLSTDEDRRIAADSIRIVRRVAAQPALAEYGPREIQPGPQVSDDDAVLAEAAGRIGTTIFHPVGTAKMGRAEDPTAVTDARLRVIGVEQLRVVDASVMPTITSGNTNSPTIMIAEKGASMILEDSR
jgi:choline dehydrogenase-like flavoprotein